MSEMENRFKADLNGWLEYISKHPVQDDTAAERIIIFNNFEQTMRYYNFTESAKEALHNVLFYVLTKHQDFITDFDLPRFEKTISQTNYWYLVQDYQLHVYAKQELWKMEPKLALELLKYLYSLTDVNAHVFYKTTVKIAFHLDEKESLYFVLDHGDTTGNNPRWLKKLEIGYECVKDAFQMINKRPQDPNAVLQMDRSLSYVDELFMCKSIRQILLSTDIVQEKQLMYSTIYVIIKLIEENSYMQKIQTPFWSYAYLNKCFEAMNKITNSNLAKMSKCERPLTAAPSMDDTRSSIVSLKEFAKTVEYQEKSESKHEHTYRTIVSYILLKSLPNQVDQESLLSVEIEKMDKEELGLDQLEHRIRANEDGRHIRGIKLESVNIIRERSMFWRSIFKVMIQFLDLWINDIIEAKCASIVARLIVQENMTKDLYHLIVKHVQLHQSSHDNADNLVIIKKFTHLLEKCFDHFDSNQELLAFRDRLYKTRREEICSPLLGSISFWNIPFQQEMTKVTNQITSTEDDTQLSEDITRKLIILTIIWPYKVVRGLFLSCAKNKDQCKAVIPILYSLNPRNIRNREQEINCELIMSVLQKTIVVENSEFLNDHMENICQFIKECLHDKSYNQDIPLVLLPVDKLHNIPTLLKLDSVLLEFVLVHFYVYQRDVNWNTGSQRKHIVLFRFAMCLLSSFFEPFSAAKYDWSSTKLKVSDMPFILIMHMDDLTEKLTRIMDIRFSYKKRPTLLSIQDYESTLSCIEKIPPIIHCIIEFDPTRVTSVCKMLTDPCQNPEGAYKHMDWKAQFLWYNFTRSLSKVAMRAPRSLFQITGALDSVFYLDTMFDERNEASADTIKGWYNLFSACKLSTRLTDEIFKCSDQWMYNLILLWKHPYQDTLVEDCLYYTLYPETSLSVSIEYPKLLIYFLGKLYNSMTGAHKMIRDYNEAAEIIPFIHDLSEQGTKNYYVILYIMKLLKRNLKQKEVTDDKQATYFISSLVKVLQGLTDWANISQRGQAATYNELKLKAKDMLLSDAPVSHIAHNNGDPAEVHSTIAEKSPETKILYYPLLSTSELVSDRALSILTLFHLCSLFQHDARQDDNQQQVVERCILQIMDGLIDMTSRQDFHRMLQQQPKNRIANWKKKESNSKFLMIIRPILTPAEANLLKPVIDDHLPNSEQILRVLGLTGEAISKKISNKEHLYFS